MSDKTYRCPMCKRDGWKPLKSVYEEVEDCHKQISLSEPVAFQVGFNRGTANGSIHGCLWGMCVGVFFSILILYFRS